MERIKIALLFTVSLISFSSCGGDHGAKNNGDTAKNSYQVPRDTTKPDSSAADSSNLDNSGSGGTKIHKPDTANKK